MKAMRRILYIVGVALIVAGLLTSIEGTVLLNDSSQQFQLHFRSLGNGLYASNNISMVGSDGLLYISNNSTELHLIPSTDIQDVNMNNLQSYTIAPNNESTIQVGKYDYTVSTGEFFTNLTGTYAVVTPWNNFTLYYSLPGKMNRLDEELYTPLLVSGTAMWIGGTCLVVFASLGRDKRSK